MGAQLLAYPFLFAAIFFETFILVTFLSKPARLARGRKAATGNDNLPTVAIIVPCWNEGITLAATADSLLALDYPAHKLEVILVDNASTDDTPAIMERYRAHPQVTIIREAQQGKHYAVNAGIAATSAEIIGCLDADSFVEPSALREMIPCFATATVGAATAAMSAHKPKNILQHMQNAEYVFGIMLKQAMSTVHGIHVTPGPFSLYRRAVVVALGGFRHGYQTEDLEMALRLQAGGYKIENAPRARVYTKTPSSVLALIRQRTRWQSGFIRNVLTDYRYMIGNRRFGALGLITLPVGLFMICGSIVLFLVVIARIVTSVLTAIELRAGVPLSYSLGLHGHFDWFYLPASLYLILAATTIVATLSMIAVGKWMSKTPGSLALGIVGYAFLYGLIAPLWLMRATADVALGKKRAWR